MPRQSPEARQSGLSTHGMKPQRFGKYEIREKIGQGAMGEVFRAHDPALGRDVAIKIVAGRLGLDENARARFEREARSAAHLNHPNIVTVHDIGEQDGTAYIVMELLEGRDLRELLKERSLRSLDDKLAVMEEILKGLAEAHSKGVVHRDLKPGNIHVLPNGHIKIMDFGLARQVEDATATAAVMGTPHYMAPEQAQGEPTTVRSDVFAVGAVFYELLSGKRAFPGPTIPAVLFAVAHREPEPLASDVPEGLAAVVSRALAKKPEDRFADAGEMLAALRFVWEGGETSAVERSVGPAFGVDEAPARALGPSLSASPRISPELRSTLQEIDEYLADRVPPLLVSGSVAEFMTCPVEDSAAELWGWAVNQRRMQPGVSMSDLLYHALYKLSVIGDVNLIDNTALLAFLRRVAAVLLEACDPVDRSRLRRGISHLGESEMVRSGPVDTLRRVAEAAEPLVPSTLGLKRLSMLEQRLRREGFSSEPVRRQVISQAIATAAREARDEKDLERHLSRLRAGGFVKGAGQVFRSLGEGLADWALPRDVASDTLDLEPPGEVDAMKKIVSLPEDPIEVARRYRHLVDTATEQFNQGNLGKAVQMYELAQDLAREKKVDPGYTEPIRKGGHEKLDPGRLRQFVENTDRHPQLQSVMGFFESGLGPAALLEQLETEDRRDRRRLLLDLLAVHAEPARALARQKLEASLTTPASDFARRNWIYLLRQLPRRDDEPIDGEVDLVARLAAPPRPAFLVKEALLHLGQIPHPRAAKALASLLQSWEGVLARSNLDEKSRSDALSNLDRLASALARLGHPTTWRVLLDHALSGRPELGAAMARLAELGTQDLSPAPDVVETLVTEIRTSLPRTMLGRLVARKDQDLPVLVAALAGTRTPAVRAVLDEVAQRFAGQEAGRVATKALQTPPAAAASPAVQSGDHDAYGLPALLHRLATSRSTGTLSLVPREGAGSTAALGFVKGQIVAARWAHRTGVDAVYQLFERPFPGNYAFDAIPPTAVSQPLPEAGALIREGVKRARELRRTFALVPDDGPLEATGATPGTVAEESDYDLVVALWQKACAGATVPALEKEIAADSFRILRPLAQWLEEGALRVVEPPRAEEPPAAPESPA
jgi:serine/threonine protein kinase